VLGATSITVQFDLDRNIDAAALDVQADDRRRHRPVAAQPAARRRPSGR
jgi:multidrug efflux pump subunit AcrB